MKKTLSLILASLMLLSAVTACGEAEVKNNETTQTEVDAGEYSADKVTENGEARAHIVVAEGADRLLSYAAEELSYHIKKVSGADVPVVSEAGTDSLPIIIATPDTLPELEEMFPEDMAWLRDLGNVGDETRWGSDGFAVRMHENKLYIFGATARGALNGTYDFIEENMGVLWVRADDDMGLIYDEVPTITVAKTDYREKSPFEIRGWHLAGFSDSNSAVTEVMLGRNKMNTTSRAAAGIADIGFGRFGVAHNMKVLIKNSPAYDPEVDEYWNTYPNGEYCGADSSTQINFFSDKAVEAMAESIIAFVRDGKEIPTLVPGDTYPFIGIEDKENGQNYPYDSEPYEYAPGQFIEPSDKKYQSTVYFSFINKVARKVAEACPGTTIATFAYMFTLPAPVCELEDNVVVVMAPISEDLAYSLYDESSFSNKKNLAAMEEWREITNNIVFYNYYGCFKSGDRYTRPIWDTIKEHLQYYKANGFWGLLPEGQGDDGSSYGWYYKEDGYTWDKENADPNHYLWAMNGMTFWIYSKLAWNPDEDVDALIAEYCDKVYGAASEPMREYYRLVKAGWDAGKADMMMDYAWNTAWEIHVDCFLINDNFEGDPELENLHEKILDTLNTAYEAADERAREHILPIKERMEATVEEFTYEP
ncbi:MAG: DUF4838 domain-containing protein [Ruminococcaceae bacterium]|nr:DUF4838 domain-containing protein [Oscillospiraceae bacterium]